MNYLKKYFTNIGTNFVLLLDYYDVKQKFYYNNNNNEITKAYKIILIILIITNIKK